MQRIGRLGRLLTVWAVRPAVGALLALAVLLTGIFLETSLSVTAQRSLTIFVFAAVLWVTKPVPLGVSSLLSVVLLPLLGVTDTFDAAATGFASRLVFFLLLLFLLGEAITKVGLDEHVARQLLTASSTPKGSLHRLSGYLLTTALFMPSGIARTVTFVPIVDRLNDLYELSERNDFLRSAYLLVGQINPIASLALMTGGGMAILSSEIIRIDIRAITWLEWLVYMLPPIVVIYGVSALVLAEVFSVNDTVTVSHTAASTVDITHDQKVVAVVITATIALWVIGSLTGLSTIVPPMLAVVVLTAPGVRVLTEQDLRTVNWGILLLFGAILSLIASLKQTGAMAFLIEWLLGLVPLTTYPVWLAIAIVLFGVVLLRLLFSTASACLAITLPVIITLAETLSIEPLFFAFSTVIIVGSTTLLPFHLPTVLIVNEHYSGLHNRDVFFVGLLSLVVASVVTALSWWLYWPML
ncbi:Na+/H+ antiporter NhaD or related arsenite permease [Halanaeroarchaeum sp. HSR-CO]|uniref:SLC13 family permease n=1 Tax=Halanaeroarchaeum sp. HSR-CO TaxID=2866382 RepID=UPI00217E4893|nr:SLC13 family permease [Halanaeroarchaeum sp. HSR-CO]UWG46330.1 Na+/H+ antiporter NhaD or related arsenite permease [Halanaeroarchaeum sp. HSR-CO]